ncbi:MAG: 4Fe-4S dicluster domain-containing protein [Nitrospiraceae bacterium]|nr:4Fe-4S dicluster domain-containing protein [Nitrospiraceae bacterium]
MLSRRNFLKYSLAGAAGLSLTKAVGAKTEEKKPVEVGKGGVRWAFLVDTYKCVGCGLCVKACKNENEVPYDENVTRTWVERYVVTKDGEVVADSPKGARDGFTTPKIDMGHGHEPRIIKPEEISKAFFVPKLCNQCENPPCVQVCPVGATYQTKEGIVLVDRTWCIGCGYCIMACPYGVRFFHPKYHTAEKCTFCIHRLHAGLKPACVEACPFGARRIGNLLDPSDPITRIVQDERVSVLKEEYGTKPQVYYIGLSKEVK